MKKISIDEFIYRIKRLSHLGTADSSFCPCVIGYFKLVLNHSNG
ncbi:hypothetical protein [Treponema putidum]|nr:hypothetical protein [Treponema putidum]